MLINHVFALPMFHRIDSCKSFFVTIPSSGYSIARIKLHGWETTYKRSDELKFGVDWSRDQSEYISGPVRYLRGISNDVIGHLKLNFRNFTEDDAMANTEPRIWKYGAEEQHSVGYEGRYSQNLNLSSSNGRNLSG